MRKIEPFMKRKGRLVKKWKQPALRARWPSLEVQARLRRSTSTIEVRPAADLAPPAPNFKTWPPPFFLVWEGGRKRNKRSTETASIRVLQSTTSMPCFDLDVPKTEGVERKMVYENKKSYCHGTRESGHTQ
jgi:hypothetical protein